MHKNMTARTSWPDLDADHIIEAVSAVSPRSGALRCVSAVRSSDPSYHATFSTAWRRYVFLLPPMPATSSRTHVEREASTLNAMLAPLQGAPREYGALGRGLPSGKSTVTTLYYASARAVALTDAAGGTATRYATRIDLVGDRFLRRQVRTLIASAAAAADEHCCPPWTSLLDAVTSGQQRLTAHPAPPHGLCFAAAGREDDEWAF